MNTIRSAAVLAVWLWTLCAAVAAAAATAVAATGIAAASAASAAEEKICGTMDIRNEADYLSKLDNCTVIDGFVQIALLDSTKSSDFKPFPKVREITQYLMVYRVTGLLSLAQLFPNLALIRGARSKDYLLLGELSLMIFDNHDLKEVGLYSLTNITRGSVLISKNPNLCYAETIDWGQITNGVINDRNIIRMNETARNMCARQQDCSSSCPYEKCWSQESGRCQYGKLNNCHPLCAGGCEQPHSARHCYACIGFMHQGECVQECPSPFFGYVRKCVTDAECRNYPVFRDPDDTTNKDLNTYHIPFHKVCRDECPYEYVLAADKKNCMPCVRTLYGNCHHYCDSFKINDDTLRAVVTKSQHKLYINCTTIKSLEIEVKYGLIEDVERRLEEYIGKVEVILDQLKIIRSYSLTSLSFMTNLYEIRGENTVNNITLVVRGNKNLQRLWTNKENTTRAVKILNGTISFHYNPKLCLSEIYKFGNLSTLSGPFSTMEVSNISNGDQFACIIYNLPVETVKIEPQTIIINIHKPVEVDNLERFLVYFIEASKLNETLEMTECGYSSWKIDDISSKKDNEKNESEIFHPITNLEPNTDYIYYVKTYTILSKTSMSKMFRSRTLPSKPSSPQNFTAQPISSSEVTLSWKPPSHPHGKLVKYVITGFNLNDDRSVLNERSYCKNKTFVGDGMTYKTTSAILKPAPVDESCQCEQPKNTVIDVCDIFEHGADIDLSGLNNRKYIFESCSNFLNIFIKTKCMAMQTNDHNVFPSTLNENCSEVWSVSNDMNNSTHKDGGLSHFFFELNEQYTTYNLSNLRHFSQYVLSILVCREIVPQELLSNEFVDSCSHETLVTFRTSKNAQADIIDVEKIYVYVNNHTVNISWEVPTLVNSMIYSFELVYKNVEEINFRTKCITMTEYEKAGRSYVIKSMMPGDYHFKVRAVSLAGEGPYTSLVSFTVYSIDSTANLNLIVMVLICGCVFIVLTGVIIRTYFSRKLSERNSMFNLANNPGYVYVEDEWELPRENVIIEKVLGRGTFGTVHEGILMPQNIPCAVKSVSKTNFLRYHAEFLNEASIMKKFSEGYHIVKLLGVVTKSYPPLLVMEIMGRGDLKSVLVASRSGDPPPPSRYIIIRMAAQIADGMAFLAFNKFIHRDLAARNCMVANDMTVKIGDFGMSRQINTDYYRKGNKGDMPIRWMAPESLSEGIFTSQSDVWSYGVVLWEMMTLGEQPYKGKNNNEVMAHVLDGNILNLPIFCPDVLAGICRQCWNWTTSQRPKFLKIVETLDVYLDEDFRSVSFYHTNSADASTADQSLMSPCTTYEEDVDNESIIFEGNDTVAVHKAFQLDKHKISNGHLSSI